MHCAASHRNDDARPNSSETAPSGARGLADLSDQILGRRLAALFLNLLLFSISTRRRRRDEFIRLRYFEETGPKMLVHLQGAP